MIHNDTYYEVKTGYGHFRLDEGSYRDYLRGRLWISGTPAGCIVNAPHMAESLPPVNISPQAVQLRELAAKHGLMTAIESLGSTADINVPYKARMSDISIDEMNLSVRSSNGLFRAGASTLGKVRELFDRDNGLLSVRNLGEKSAKEIRIAFLSLCYQQLSAVEKAAFWQNMIEQGCLSDS